jgi:hypothetical protein
MIKRHHAAHLCKGGRPCSARASAATRPRVVASHCDTQRSRSCPYALTTPSSTLPPQPRSCSPAQGDSKVNEHIKRLLQYGTLHTPRSLAVLICKCAHSWPGRSSGESHVPRAASRRPARRRLGAGSPTPTRHWPSRRRCSRSASCSRSSTAVGDHSAARIAGTMPHPPAVRWLPPPSRPHR